MKNKKQGKDIQNREILTKHLLNSYRSRSLKAAGSMILAGTLLMTPASSTIHNKDANIVKAAIMDQYRSDLSGSLSKSKITPPIPAAEIKAGASSVPSLNLSNSTEVIAMMNSTKLSNAEIISLSKMIKQGAVNSGNGQPSYLSQPSYINEIVQTAQSCGSSLGVPWTFIFSLWTEETGYFTSNLAVFNLNFAGIKGPDNGWSDFNSISSFGNFFTSLLETPSYIGATKTGNFALWVRGLMNAHFDVGDTISSYTDKVKSVMDFIFSNPNLKDLRRNVIILAAAIGAMMLLSGNVPLSIGPYFLILKNQLHYSKLLSFIKGF